MEHLKGFRQKNITSWKNGSPRMPCALFQWEVTLKQSWGISTVVKHHSVIRKSIQEFFLSMPWNYWFWCFLRDTTFFLDGFYLPQVNFHLQKPTVWNRYGQDTKSKLQHNDWQYNTVHRKWLKWKAVTYIQGSISWNSLVTTVNADCSEQEISLATET